MAAGDSFQGSGPQSSSSSSSNSNLLYYILPGTLALAAAAAYFYNKNKDRSSSTDKGHFGQEETKEIETIDKKEEDLNTSYYNSSSIEVISEKSICVSLDSSDSLVDQDNTKVVAEEIKDIVNMASSKSTPSLTTAPIGGANDNNKKLIQEEEQDKHNASWSDIIEEDERKEIKNKQQEIEAGLTNLRLTSEEQSRPNTADSNTNGASDNGFGGSLCEEGENSSSNSIVCSDSGRGSEPDDVTGASASPGTILGYHFHIPSSICGKLIGVRGASVHQLKATSKCKVILKEIGSNKQQQRRKLQESTQNNEFQICIIEGTRTGIEKCLELIREKFPLNEYPELTLEQVNIPHNNISPALQLACGIMNEVQVSTIVSPCHVFLQQPSHPTFPALERLNACMYRCYTELNTPQLEPSAIDIGVVCVALCDNSWYRVQIVSPFDPSNSEYCDVKFLDYGGYISLPVSNLRQIRSDFLTLPFQAIECYLANITPPASCEIWPQETTFTLEELISYKIGTASWIGIAEDGIPMVHLFVNDGLNPSVTINVNRELVDRQAASWIEHAILESSSSSSSINTDTLAPTSAPTLTASA